MNRLTFQAWQGDRYIGIRDILTALEDVVAGLQWRVRIDEMASGPGPNRLKEVGPDAWLDTSGLLDATANDVQVIDGQLSGYQARESASPHILVRAVDSTWWDIESDDDDVAQAVVNRLPNVVPMPQ
jgi:hypothetical protein